jgi:twitching motility protein PilT
VSQGLRATKGLVLITGDLGCGMSSMIATMLAEVAKKGSQLLLVLDEDVDFELPGAKSVLVKRRIGEDAADYQTALASAIRDDPDVIAIGDVSYPRTFDLALRAAEGGRLVIAGLHARSVCAALQRIIGFYSAYEVSWLRATLASVLNCVMRLQPIPKTKANGNLMASELLIVDPAARSVLREGPLDRLDLLMNMTGTLSGYSLDTSLEALLHSGEASFDECFHAADNKARLLKGQRARQGSASGIAGGSN